jgi:hypothetical protein
MAKKLTIRERKELNSKIAEIIWLSLAGIILLTGLLFSITGVLIDSITGNFKNSPLYFLIEAQDGLFTWVKTWWTGFPFSTFASAGLVLLGVGLVFLLLILLVYSNKQEIDEKKEKARKLRENNVKRFEAQLENISKNQEAK